jgi:HAE1 family hydrophobic/amphiphilic exporter-1
MTTLVTLAILFFGMLAYPRLPVSDLPTVDMPTIQVNASLPGASPETMASAVATPLEKAFSTIPGIDSMSSASQLGSTSITLQFSMDRDVDAAAQDVQSAISQAQRQLPTDMPTPPTYAKVNPAMEPILYIALTSPILPLSKLDDYGQNLIGQRISMVNGVAQVMIYGSQKYAVRIQVDPAALAARGIGIDEVQAAVQAANVNLPTGVFDGSHHAWTIQTFGQLLRAEAYKPIIVAQREGNPVRLQDIAEVKDSVENDKSAAWFCTKDTGQQRAIVLAVQRQPGTNTVEVAEAVKKLLPQFRDQLPASVSLAILYDRALPIKESVADVKLTMAITLGLVVLVIFLFLRNVRATIIPSLTLPLSLVGTFAVMYLLGFSLDNLSLMALTLAVGFVVDDAIVMLENVYRHAEMGKTVMQAAFDGSKEIAFTILSMTLSLVAVFIPVLFMGGIVGRLFREFAVTIGVAVLVSGVISLTLTPMLCSRFLKPHSLGHGTEVGETPKSWFQLAYGRTLRWTIGHKGLFLVVSIAVMVLTGWLFKITPKGFIPNEDQGRINATTEAAQGISFSALVAQQQAVADTVLKHPAVDCFMSRVGSGGGGGSSNTGGLFLRLKPRSERTQSADEVIQDLRGMISKEIPGIRVFLRGTQPIQIGPRVSKGQYQYTLLGTDQRSLFEFSIAQQKRLATLPELQDVSSDLQIANPQVNLEIDRDRAADLQVSPEKIENALYSAYGPRQISTIYAADAQYRVLLGVRPADQTDSNALDQLHVRSATGRLIPLRELVKDTEATGPLSITHTGQFPSVTISFNLKPGVSIGQAIDAIAKLTSQDPLPAGVSASFQGTAQEFQRSFAGMGMLLLITVLAIYMVLGILYEDFIHPLTILTALPFAGAGALITLLIFKTELSIYAFVGIIMLVGIVKKNGIMMIDFAIAAQRDHGLSPTDAIVSACVVRFRPIMMTTMAALMAGLPIALGLGAGAESRRPLGLAVTGGLLFSQFLTLYITPIFYVWVETLRHRRQAK